MSLNFDGDRQKWSNIFGAIKSFQNKKNCNRLAAIIVYYVKPITDSMGSPQDKEIEYLEATVIPLIENFIETGELPDETPEEIKNEYGMLDQEVKNLMKEILILVVDELKAVQYEIDGDILYNNLTSLYNVLCFDSNGKVFKDLNI